MTGYRELPTKIASFSALSVFKNTIGNLALTKNRELLINRKQEIKIAGPRKKIVKKKSRGTITTVYKLGGKTAKTATADI